MAKTKQVVLVLIAVTIGGVLFTPLASSVADNSGTVSVTNESVTADAGNYTDLDGYQIVDGSETVYNASGAEQTAGTDYEMANENGSIKVLSGGSISDGETITVSYDYKATSGSTTTVVQLVPLFMALLILGVLAEKVQRMM